MKSKIFTLTALVALVLSVISPLTGSKALKPHASNKTSISKKLHRTHTGSAVDHWVARFQDNKNQLQRDAERTGLQERTLGPIEKLLG